MKKLLAASLAAFFLFTAAGCAQKPQTQDLAAPVEPDAQTQQPEEQIPEQPQDNVIQITPNQQQTPVDNSDWSWLDEPETIQTDLEETVTCTYTLPHLTLSSDDASAAANAVFDDLSQTVLSYAQETVYPAAQEKQAIGYVNGGYSISEGAGELIVDYTLSVSYSTESGDQQFRHTYTISLSTGELLKEE